MRRTQVSIVLMAVAGMAVAVWAQERPALRGPEVRETRIPGVEQGFTEGRRRDAAEIPQRVFMAAVGKLRGPEAPAAVRLSEEQEVALREIERDFREASRRFEERTRQAQRDRADAPMAGDEGEQRRRRLEEIRRDAPRPLDWQTKVYAVLNESQRDAVKAELEVWREQMEKRRQEEYMQRRLRERGAEAPNAAAPARDAAPGRDAVPEGRERLRRIGELLMQLPAEDRERILNRIEEELAKRVRERAQDGKPAPAMDEVAVPPQEGERRRRRPPL